MATVYGTAGGGLKNPTWLDDKSTAAAGLRGEKALARHLESIVADGVVILHDLTIPGSKANIDHAVVSGNQVTLIDAKLWKPGIYWTLAGRTRRVYRPDAASRRKLEAFPPADKKTMPFAKKRVEGLLLARGVHAVLRQPLIAVYSSRTGENVNLWFARTPEARFLNAETLSSRLIGKRRADPRVVDVLRTLLP